jgi:hypothetical protein
MNEPPKHEFAPEKFLTIASNILYKSFFEAARTDAKNMYKALAEGKRVALINLKMEDDSELRFDVSLDGTEFCGTINFGAFRSSLQALIGSTSGQLEAEKEIVTFTERESGEILFGVPGLTQEDGQLNALMLSGGFSAVGVVHLKLQYMEPGQFVEPDTGQA